MKKLLFVLLASTILSTLNAQVQKDAVILGGSIIFNGNDNSNEFSSYNANSSDYKSNFLSISPQIGYFATESLLLGIGLTFEHRDQEYQSQSYSGGYNGNTDKTRSNLFLINPYVTKYSKLNNKLYLTSTVKLQAGFGTEQDTKVFELRVNATPGLTYFVSEKWALKCSIGQLYYNRKKYTPDNDNNDDDDKNIHQNYGLNLSLNTFTVGFQYILNKKIKETI